MKSKGCNGFAYTMDYATEKGKMDVEVVQDGEPSALALRHCPDGGITSVSLTDWHALCALFFSLGVKVLIAPKALMSIVGTEMDFVKDKASSGFVFNNPNVKGTCGCGESFNFVEATAQTS